jgi:hypothetical protein
MSNYTNAGLVFSASNGLDGSTTLYLGESNSLVVTIGMGEGTLASGNASLLLRFDSGLSAATWADSTSSTSGCSAQQEQVQHITQWRLEPELGATQLVVTLAGLAPPVGSPPTTKIYLIWSGLAGVPDGNRTQRIGIDNPPNAQAQLDLQLAWITPDVPQVARNGSEVQLVWVSTGEAYPIANCIAFSISNTSNLPVVAPDNPGHPVFYLSFDTVTDPQDAGNFDALCTIDQVRDMWATLNTDGLTAWDLASKAETDGRWILTPKSDSVLNAHQSLTITLHNLVTSLPTFVTTLYVNWENVPGYRNGTATLPLQKRQALPTIYSFDAEPDDNLAAGQQVKLSWSTYGNRIPGPVRIHASDKRGGEQTVVADSQSACGFINVFPEIPTSYQLELVDTNPLVLGGRDANVQPATVDLVVDQPSVYYVGSEVTLTATIGYATSYELSAQVFYTKINVVEGITFPSPGSVELPGISRTNLLGSKKFSRDVSLAISRLPDLLSPDSYQFQAELACQLTVYGYQGPQHKTVNVNIVPLPFFRTSSFHTYQEGLDIQPNNVWFNLAPGWAMILVLDGRAEGCIYGGLNLMLSDPDGSSSVQGTPVAMVLDREWDSNGNDISYTVRQISSVVGFNPQSYVLQQLALAPPMPLNFSTAIGLLNAGPGHMYLNWVDGPAHTIAVYPITPEIGWKLTCDRNKKKTPVVACGWNFTGYVPLA